MCEWMESESCSHFSGSSYQMYDPNPSLGAVFSANPRLGPWRGRTRRAVSEREDAGSSALTPAVTSDCAGDNRLIRVIQPPYTLIFLVFLSLLHLSQKCRPYPALSPAQLQEVSDRPPPSLPGLPFPRVRLIPSSVRVMFASIPGVPKCLRPWSSSIQRFPS